MLLFSKPNSLSEKKIQQVLYSGTGNHPRFDRQPHRACCSIHSGYSEKGSQVLSGKPSLSGHGLRYTAVKGLLLSNQTQDKKKLQLIKDV